ncbi:MAG: hypothetical protein KF764_17500 [Labilithrix sp.]|nr:hypothetical protein [Labilithrix sp.]
MVSARLPRCLVLGIGLSAVLSAFAACGDDAGGGAAAPLGMPPAPSVLGKCDPGKGEEAEDKTSGFLLLTESRLAKVRADAAANSPAFQELRATADRFLTDLNVYKSGAENAALMYLLTSEARYATSAYAWAKQVMAGDLRAGSYLEYGEMMRPVALVLNWAGAGLTADQRRELADFLEASTNELWFANTGSKWGISDDEFAFAGNNYRMAFIEGTAFAGHALEALGDARGRRWIDLAVDKIVRPGGVLEYMDKLQSGGDWLEGTNYGERSKQRLYRALAVIASMGGKNFFRENPYFANSIEFSVYQAQPGNRFLYPGGDLARSAASEISPYDREYVQIATYWLCDSPARRLGQHYLTKIAPSYNDEKHSFDYGAGKYLEVLFALDLPAHDVTTLPLSFRAAGTNWINARSGWDERATSVSISGAPVFTQSHQHQDMGSFVIWKDRWLAMNPETTGGEGPFWPAETKQGLHVPGREARFDGDPVPGLARFADRDGAVYAQVDMSNLYRKRPGSGAVETLLNEHTRELVYVRPDTVFVFDRVDAKPAGAGYALHFHFPSAPREAGGVYSATNEGPGIAVAPLLGGAVSVAADSDLGSKTHRIVQAATGAVSRFLSVVEVGSDGAPSLSAEVVGAPGAMRGALRGDHVVLFSDLPRGAPPALPFSYTVPGTGSPKHVLVNLTGSFRVAAERSGGSTTVTVSAGNDVVSGPDGLLVVTP